MRKVGLWLTRAVWRLAFVTMIAFVLAGCSLFRNQGASTQSLANTPAPAATQTHTPVPIPPTPLPPTPVPLPPLTISIASPAQGTLVGSPVVIAGQTDRLPASGVLSYRFTDSAGQQLSAATFPVSGAPGQPGIFNASLEFPLPREGGIVHLDMFEAGQTSAPTRLDMAVDAQYQQITIDTPPPSTVVGNPVRLTGQTKRATSGDILSYEVLNSGSGLLGNGTLSVSGAPGGPRFFNEDLFFNLPINGDTITIKLSASNPQTGAAEAQQQISLVVLPVPQQITIDTPPLGAPVGSPMVITGRTTRFPFQGDLAYRITDDGGQLLGPVGTFQVVGQIDESTTFNALLTFAVPHEGGTIHLDVYDQNPSDGSVVATTRWDLDVLPQYQRIDFVDPPSGRQVGSPMVIKGRTNLYPNRGQLIYHITDSGNRTIGTGNFPMDSGPNQRGSFNVSLFFTEPPNGGTIQLELIDQADGGAIIARSTLALVVAPAPPQQIVIDTPPFGTQVGSPVVLTGRTTRIPASGQLNYRVRDAAGAVIGTGVFLVNITTSQATSFSASLTFTEPRAGGTISIEIADQNAVGAVIANASIALYVAPRP